MTRAEALRIFELDDPCTPEQVRASYRELVKVWHPDRFANDAGLRAKADRRLQEINRAYGVLQDRAETLETPQETTPRPNAATPPPGPTPPVATHRPHVATPRPGARSMPARWSLATLVVIGLVIGAGVVGLVLMLARPSQQAPAPSPISGTDLLAAPAVGDGSLSVLNADGRDAVLVFVDAGVQRRAVYLRGGETLQMLDVAPGSYRIWIAAGRGWSGDHFLADQIFQELEEPLAFATERSAPRTITIAAPGTGTGTRLRARAPFVLNSSTR